MKNKNMIKKGDTGIITKTDKNVEVEIKEVNGDILKVLPMNGKEILLFHKSFFKYKPNLMPVENFPTQAKIKFLGEEPKIVDVADIDYKNGKLYRVSILWPVGNNNPPQRVSYYFDGRKLGEENDIDVNEIFLGFVK